VFDLVTHGGGKVILDRVKVAFFEKLIEMKKVQFEQNFLNRNKRLLKYYCEKPLPIQSKKNKRKI
jgi:hypothetical protein